MINNTTQVSSIYLVTYIDKADRNRQRVFLNQPDNSMVRKFKTSLKQKGFTDVKTYKPHTVSTISYLDNSTNQHIKNEVHVSTDLDTKTIEQYNEKMPRFCKLVVDKYEVID